MSFEVKVYEDTIGAACETGLTLAAGANLALTHRLYVNGWTMVYELSFMAAGKKRGKIAIGFKNNVPVAVALCDRNRHMMAFCRSKERRNGYASACVAAIRPEQRTYACEGVRGSWKFWTANQVIVEQCR